MKFSINDRIISNSNFQDILNLIPGDPHIRPNTPFVIVVANPHSLWYILEEEDPNVVNKQRFWRYSAMIDRSFYLNPDSLQKQSSNICEHLWTKYSGLTDEFTFCTKCDEKQL